MNCALTFQLQDHWHVIADKEGIHAEVQLRERGALPQHLRQASRPFMPDAIGFKIQSLEGAPLLQRPCQAPYTFIPNVIATQK